MKTELLAAFETISAAEGWHQRSVAELSALAEQWTMILSDIPPDLIEPLTREAIQRRACDTAAGKRVPVFAASYLLGVWHSGKIGVDYRAARDRDAQAAVYAQTAKCQRCLGTGIEYIYGDDGVVLGARPGCIHRRLMPDEGLAVYLKERSGVQLTVVKG